MYRVRQPPDLLEVCGVVVISVEVFHLLAVPEVFGPGPHTREMGVQLRPKDVDALCW